MGTNWRAVKAEDELTTLRADLAATLERVGELESLAKDSRVALKEYIGKFIQSQQERDQLKRERDEAVAYQGEHRQAAVDGGYIQGFEDCREAVAVRYDTLAAEIEAEVGGDVVSRLSLRQGARAARKEAAAIHALTVPERKETKE